MAIRSIQRNNNVRYNEYEGKLPKGRKREGERETEEGKCCKCLSIKHI